MKKLKTKFDGEVFTHRLLWEIVEGEAKLASKKKRGWFNHSLVAMVFAFHTVEAYLNFVGERFAPEEWKDERNFFRKKPYRGWDGKLRYVMDLVELRLSRETPPLKTIFDLQMLRDLIAHGKPEKLKGEVEGTGPLFPVSTLRSLVTQKQKLELILSDVEQLLDQIHGRARNKIKEDDPWFGAKALRGPSAYNVGSTTLT